MRETGVVIAGGGISGLTTAYELSKKGVDFVLVEKTGRLGGLVGTDRVDGFILDHGPDAFLTQKPEALSLAAELGLTPRVVPTNLARRSVYVLWRGELRKLPEGMRLTVPTLVGPLLRSPLFSLRGKLRLLAERFVPRRSADVEEESIATFIRRRFGAEALERVGEPLLAGIHCGDPSELSMDALFPRLVALETRFGSLSGAMTRAFGDGDAAAFASFDTGIGALVDALTQALPREQLIVGEPVEAVAHEGEGFVTHLAGGERIRSRALVVALPLRAAETLVAPSFPSVAEAVSLIPTASTAVVFHAFDEGAVRHALDGYGFVVPETEPSRLLAGTFVSTKFPGRAPPGKVLLRSFLGGARDPDALSLDEDALIELSLRELDKVLGFHGPPLFSKLRRWIDRTPQVRLGHGKVLAALQRARRDHPGLYLLGNGLASVGIPDCIGEARKVASAIRVAAGEGD